MSLTTEKIKILRTKMLRGDIKKIAMATSFSREYVGRCLSSKTKSYNIAILDAAVRLVNVHTQITQKVLKSVK